jgi:hypothetical protein
VNAPTHGREPAAALPPSLAHATSRRHRARAAGLDPDYWYPVEYDRSVKPGQVVEVKFSKTSIALYRGADGVLRALENRCAHRQLALTLGDVTGCHLACAYHGWTYDGHGRLVDVPHDLFGRSMPNLSIASHPVKVRYGLIWIFPGDPARAEERRIPDIPELEGPRRWACVPLDFTWRAHHSIVIDNVSDFTHAHLHRTYRPFVDSTLLTAETRGDRVFMRYRTNVGMGRLSQRFVDRKRVDTTSMELCYDYPYQWSDTAGKIKHWCFPVPVDEGATRVFFLFYFESLKIPFLPWRIPRAAMTLVLRVANRVLIAPLLRQDGFAVEAEQRAWDAHRDVPVPELNPIIGLFHQLTVRKWEEYLARRAGSVAPRASP